MHHRIVSGGYHPAEQKKWRLCSSPALSDSCHLTKRNWMEVRHGASSSGPRSKRRLFIASVPSRVYDHSLPHSRLATIPPGD
ncbi:unnamed protein product [Spirodela intermedia]|uniref:Uncharacterized protein n=1 Tax=Spirodela intermedia TaxID=51605 RepID=A0A7I8J4U5_SPIIN|nr:unnamed protein product [Spirodela intermedia]CAA2634847.1 unnamed protein product [Spirodela intermedia]CAA6665268.1 unnamed protein product [Spirodela intermedia]CAA6673820.1 unnamed protein product [Spirodela intermedia]